MCEYFHSNQSVIPTFVEPKMFPSDVGDEITSPTVVVVTRCIIVKYWKDGEGCVSIERRC